MSTNRRGKSQKLYPFEYGVWASMKQRCNNPNSQMWHRYGARGITYQKSWESFDEFIKDMGKKPKGVTRQYSLDRIDNDKNYTAKNCRWATTEEQSLNRSNTRLLTFRGKIHPMATWTKILGFNRNLIPSRLRYEWSVEDALSFPVLPDGKTR